MIKFTKFLGYGIVLNFFSELLEYNFFSNDFMTFTVSWTDFRLLFSAVGGLTIILYALQLWQNKATAEREIVAHDVTIRKWKRNNYHLKIAILDRGLGNILKEFEVFFSLKYL